MAYHKLNFVLQAIDEESRIALPFGEKEIKGAINSVLGVIDKVKDYPNQAFSTIETAKMRYTAVIIMIKCLVRRRSKCYHCVMFHRNASRPAPFGIPAQSTIIDFGQIPARRHFCLDTLRPTWTFVAYFLILISTFSFYVLSL